MKGEGVAVSKEKAFFWLQKASDQGLDVSNFVMGYMLIADDGVVRNPIKAYAYFKISEETVPQSRINVGRLESEMSPSDIAKGKEHALKLQKQIAEKIAAKKAGK
jgi:TPR repeat protein